VADIACICRQNGLWFQVDAAYGGSLGIIPEYRHLRQGVEETDSFVLNPHKMMMVPLDCSLLYTRHPEALRNAFSLEAEYLKTDASGALDYADYGLALGRRFRALKVWFVMSYFDFENGSEWLHGWDRRLAQMIDLNYWRRQLWAWCASASGAGMPPRGT
jgi:aromatic-L-amino-acid/L-tryptophan decarboxylase